jgi:hypothetical protein
MRSPIRSLARAALLCSLAACSGESAPGAPQALATRPVAAQPRKQSKAPLAPSAEVVEALAHARPARAPSAAPLPKPAVRAVPQASTVHGPLDTSRLDSRGLLRWLPPDATLVLRFPHVEALGELRRRTALGALLQNPALMMALCAPSGPLGELNAKIRAELPELEALLEKLPQLQGELVIGLSHLELAGAAPKATLALAFDAGAGADELQQLLDPLLERLQRENAAESARIDGGSGLVGWNGEACFQIRRFGNVFTALCGNDPEFEHAFQPETETESFASAPAVASAADLNKDGKGVLEFYLNADPAWTLVKSQAPAEAQSVIEKLGLFGVHGASMTLGLGEKGMAEAHTWSAPTHADIVTRIVAAVPARRELARWIPEDAESAGLSNFDLHALYDAIVSVLPEAQRAELHKTLAQWKSKTRIDLPADVIGNFGPAFAFVSRGDSFGLSGGPAGVCLAIETHDDDKVGELLGKLAPLLPPAFRRRSSEFSGHAMLSYDLSTLGMALSSVTLCRVDGALLVATDEKLLERCLLAGKQAGIKPAALATALAREGVIGANLSAAIGDLPSTLTVMCKSESGLTLTAADGSGSAGTGALMVVPIVSAVAIPKLMSARLCANEAAATATMNSLASAEAQLQSSGAVDVDRDGAGEYGTFGELCGLCNLRGDNQPLEPSILPKLDVKNGILTRSGYHFTVFLPAKTEGLFIEPKAADGRDVCADRAEISWIGWGWPVDAGATGNRIFVLDQEGDLMSCANAFGRYSGLQHRPAFDAYLPKDDKVDRIDGKPYQGRDGLTWQMIPESRRFPNLRR